MDRYLFFALQYIEKNKNYDNVYAILCINKSDEELVAGLDDALHFLELSNSHSLIKKYWMEGKFRIVHL